MQIACKAGKSRLTVDTPTRSLLVRFPAGTYLWKRVSTRFRTDRFRLDKLIPPPDSLFGFVSGRSSSSFERFRDRGRIRTIIPPSDRHLNDLVLGAGLEPA